MKQRSYIGSGVRGCVSLACALLISLLAGEARAVTAVSNITVAQRPGTKLIDISYDVSSTQTNLVTVTVAISNATGLLSASHYTGDIGVVATGAVRKIVWDGGADQEGQNLTGLRVILSATDGGSAAAPSGMAAIPAGSFMMGSSSALPIHNVQLSAFHMDQTEMTKGAWDVVASWAATNGYTVGNAEGKGSNHPAQKMTWHSAVIWCNARSEMAGLTPCYTNANGSVFKSGTFAGGCNWSANGFRLPTEAEWEYAARGTGTTHRFSWTDCDTIQHTRANYWSTATSYDTSLTRGYHPAYATNNMPYTSPAGSFAPNAYGLYDMVGNVFEWCWDWYSAQYPTTPVLNPRGTPTGSARVARGGSWGGSAPNPAWSCYVYYRASSAPNGYTDYLGFRCVKSAPSVVVTIVTSAPFNADLRTYTLTVTSAFGTPVPSIGVNNYAWRATVTGAVQSVVSLGGTNRACTGWTGTGSVPASGAATNTGTMTLTNLTSSLTWHWTVSAFKPAMTAQPQSRTNVYATTAVFTATATGMPAVAYQWRRNGTNLVNGGRISGALGNTLTVSNTLMSDAGSYTVVASNAMGSVTSQVATLTMNKAVASVSLGNLNQTYTGLGKAASATTTPSGLTVNLTYNGSPVAPTNAGSYTVVGTINNTNYAGSSTGTLVIAKASQTICLDALPPEVTLQEERLPLATNASSGLPIQYSSANQMVATVSDCTVLIAGVGFTTISAEQSGDANYLPTQSSKGLVVVNPNFGQWAEALGLVGTLGDLFAQDRNNDGIPNGFEYAFGTNLVPSDVLLKIRIVNGQPMVEVPLQDAATVDYVQVWVEGCTNLLDGVNGWTLPVEVIEGAVGQPSNRAWYETTGMPAQAFFRLKADLKP